MNCLEFRKSLLAEPGRRSPALSAHSERCVQCRQFEAGVARFEQLLGEAAAIPVPEGLETRILERAGRSAPATGSAAPDRRRFLAMAASVGVAAVGSLAFIAWRHRDTVVDLLVAHALEAHPPGLVRRATPAAHPEAATRALLAAFGVQAGPLAGLPIEDAWACAPLGRSGVHLLLATPDGVLHVLLAPGETRRLTRRLERRGQQVELHPHALGTLTLVAASAADLDALRPAVLAAFGTPAGA